LLAGRIDEKVLLAECRIRSEPFVEEVRGGRRRPPGDKGGMGWRGT